MGFVRVANETMCRPIRNITQVGHIHGSTSMRCMSLLTGQGIQYGQTRARMLRRRR